MMKQILFVNTQSPMDPCAGGIASYIRHRACLLSRHGMIVWWSDGRRAARYDGIGKAWEPAIELNVRKNRWSAFWNWWLPATPLWAFLMERKIDLVEFPDGVTAQWPARRPFRIFVMCHATQDVRRFLSRAPVRFRHWSKQWMVKECLVRADKTAACSHEIMWMTSGFYRIHPDCFSVLPHAFCREAESFSTATAVPATFFLVVGNMEYCKGFDLIAAGYGRYRKAGGKARLAVAGTAGWEDLNTQTQQMLRMESVRQLVREQGRECLHFLGQLEKEELSKWRDQCLACVIGSRFESFTMVAGEAFLSGTPLILSSRTGWRTLAARYDAARLCDPYDPEDLARAFFEMEDPALRARYVAGGHALAGYLTGETLLKATVEWYT